MECCFKHDCKSIFKYNQIKVDCYHSINVDLNKELIVWKNKINNNKLWDTSKRYTNKYEMIFSHRSNLIKKKPLSRSYFKLWEILHDFKIFEHRSSRLFKTAHIAEGPGGFIECICDYFKMYNIPHDKIHGITLKSQDKKIPYWKLSKELINSFDIKLFTKNDGNIYNEHVIHHFINDVHKNTCHFITADGGFDFSSDFNNQEQQCHNLLLSQIFVALSLQSYGGHFLLKVFDIFSKETIKLISLCSMFYSEMYIIKPNTSRPANSEKYILFMNCSDRNDNILKELHDCIKYKKNINDIYCNEDIYYTMLKNLTEYNIFYTFNQIAHIKNALKFERIDKKEISYLMNENENICNNWCKRYFLE